MSEVKNGNVAKPFERLPKTVVPSHYRITLEPDLVQLTFTGEEIIDLVFKEETNKIVLNSLHLDIKTASFKSHESSTETPPPSIELNPDDEQLVLTFPSDFKVGTKGQLILSFSGVLNDKFRGFYRARYPQQDGKPDKFAATTHFEPTGARWAFPSWDEPAIKATFEIILIADKDKTTLSNMPVVQEKLREDGKKVVYFDVTPIMSTYLVAFVVGDYDFVESKTTDGKVVVRVYTPPGKKDQGRFSLDVASRALPFYSDYFGIPYPLPKLDMIAISDYPIGAMENWGLVTYRETRVLIDEANTSASYKQMVALVVSHELAHSWFGNLVTMYWWTDLWLKEGFANFMEHLCLDHLFPEYKTWEQFVPDTYSQALDLDALNNSHPIEVVVNNPSEVDEIFDIISYDKGASILRMLYHYIGDEDFRKGISLYLKTFAYKNTQTQDLWDVLEKTAGKPVGAVMSTWTKQMGYPVVRVSAEVDGSKTVVSYSQEKFCADGKTPNAFKETLYMIPLTFVASDHPTALLESTLLPVKTGQVVFPSTYEWIKVNRNAVGFHRVNYSASMLEKLLPAIESKVLPALDRLNIQSDLFALAQAGHSSTTQVLKLLESFMNEDSYPVWRSISSCLGTINQLLSNTNFQASFHVWGRKIFQSVYARLGWTAVPDEDYTTALLRPIILCRLATFNEPTVVAQAQRLFDAHVKGTAILPADIRSAVYSAIAQNGNQQTFETFMKLYKSADSQEERNRTTAAMAIFKDHALIERLLNFSISNEVRPQDINSVIRPIAYNNIGRGLLWKFFKTNQQVFKERYGASVMMGRVVDSVTFNFASEEMAQEIEEFFKQNPFPGAERTVRQSLENIRMNASWLARDEGKLQEYLAKVVM